jgi:SAM-dependent methyltransferase
VPTRTMPSLPVRALDAIRRKGPRYAWHKALRRGLSRWPDWKRRLLYADPRDYWTLRGGDEYYREQEGQAARTERADWLAARIAGLQPTSILEVGCGYGKQLRAIRRLIDVPMVGLDFSPSQLGQGAGYLEGLDRVSLVLGTGDRLPFDDGTFDLVLTSAVILHNPPEVADRIRREVLRVSRRLAAHNEDTDVTYNRFGYDTAAWYQTRGLPVLESGPIPVGSEASQRVSQFCVAGPWTD